MSPQPVRRRPWHRLDPDFVKAVRTAYRREWPNIHRVRDLRRMPWHGFEQIYAGSGSSNVVAREGSPDARRLQQLAHAIGYDGPTLGEVTS